MSKLVSFIIYNIIVYILYAILDSVFSFFDVYSNSQLGTDLFIMPTDKDLVYIIINVVISTVLGYILLKKIKY